MNRQYSGARLGLAVLLVLCSVTAYAAAPEAKAEKRLVAKVFTDGTLFGFAKTCEVPEPDLKQLYDRNYASSRAIGIARVPQYSQDDFRRDFQNGIATADRFSASVAPTSKAYIQNCKEVRKKVSLIVKGVESGITRVGRRK